MILQSARMSDWEAINAISRQVQEMHVRWRPDIFRESDCNYPADLFRELVDERVLYVARLEEQVAGYVLFRVWQTNGSGAVESRVLDIDDFCVDEAYRRQGIGTRMMEELRLIAKELACNELQLSVYPQNENAVSFYEKCGFQVRCVRYSKEID